MWSRGLAGWYRSHGRHDLPWRQTRDPWLILLSEVMLQQTQVARVLGPWRVFAARWPSCERFAAAELAEVLRAWQGLGYPRRAVALHRTAAHVAAHGWPADEAGLRGLPGVGRYTARALLTLAFDKPGPVPGDVNITRVVARAALGVEPRMVPAARLDQALAAGRPARLAWRDYTFALFDAGALHCRSAPRCQGCPLSHGCAWRSAGQPAAAARRSPRYAGSMRELRGAVLAALLAGAPADSAALSRRIDLPAARRAGAVAEALHGLARDGLIPEPPGRDCGVPHP